LSFAFEIKNENVSHAHAMLLEFDAPEVVKTFIREAIAGLASIHGEDVMVNAKASGHLCLSGWSDGSDAQIAVWATEAKVEDDPAPASQEGRPPLAQPPDPPGTVSFSEPAAAETPPAPTADGELEPTAT
jgi:hypothetical protein